uniref:Late transcription factor 1 n=1 Tax=Rhabditophanes sp. KR3021 TaxID=114890 RepID=A0AC35U3T8_9BILA
MVPTMENVGNGYYINSLGHFLNTIFEESKIVRQNTQRLAIIVTDNEDIIIGEAEKDEFRSDHNLNLADIHPVFVNFNKNKTASEIYLLSGIKFSGTDSNLIVFHNYINNEELFVKVLLDGNVLCAKNESMPETTKNSAIFPIIYGNNKKGRRYCNNMKITTFCKIIDINVPIVVTINNMDIQPQKDLISIFDDNSNLRSVISGHQISGLNVTIPDSKFVKVVFTTGPTKVYYGGQITFDNCIVDS